MPTPGFIGKIPSQGDFVHRRLPWEFIDAWDAWMQASMTAARARMEDRWLEFYLVAPVWRFLLTEGACDRNAWLGLWFPSVDRVGRHFPMTVAVPVPAQLAHPTLLLKLGAWLTEVEDAALVALDPRTTLEQLNRALASLPCEFPPDSPHAACSLHAGPTSMHGIADRQTLDALLSAPHGGGRTTSYWHTWGTNRIGSTLLISERLLDAAAFAASISGDWLGNGLSPRFPA